MPICVDVQQGIKIVTLDEKNSTLKVNLEICDLGKKSHGRHLQVSRLV